MWAGVDGGGFEMKNEEPGRGRSPIQILITRFVQNLITEDRSGRRIVALITFAAYL